MSMFVSFLYNEKYFRKYFIQFYLRKNQCTTSKWYVLICSGLSGLTPTHVLNDEI